MPDGGVLVCHAYRVRGDVIYLDHSGAHPRMEPDCDVNPGGDWVEFQMIHEDNPPTPPQGDGLWRMEAPWQNANHRPKGHTCSTMEADGWCDCDFDDEEICCRYTESPSWTLLVPAPSRIAP